MDKKNEQFSVMYNGHATTITVLDHCNYLAQITYKPIHIQVKKDDDGMEHWVEKDSQQSSYVTNELGKLISSRMYSESKA
jgi:hypothetical protein